MNAIKAAFQQIINPDLVPSFMHLMLRDMMRHSAGMKDNAIRDILVAHNLKPEQCSIQYFKTDIGTHETILYAGIPIGEIDTYSKTEFVDNKVKTAVTINHKIIKT